MAPDLFEDETKFIEDVNRRLEDGTLNDDAVGGAISDALQRYERLLRTTRRLIRIGDLTSDQQRKDARTDALTEIDNRRAFLASLKREVARALRFKEALSVLICDIDHFKAINDTFGHDVGDVALRHFAKTVADALREIDLFGRIGGEEFAIILPATDRAGATITAERVREKIEALVIDACKDATVSFTVSIGGACLRSSGDDPSTMMERADQALYNGKKADRNKVVFND